MYHLNYILHEQDEEQAKERVKMLNEQPNTTAQITGVLMEDIEIEVSISFDRPSQVIAISHAKSIADINNIDVWSLTRTETIATEEIFD